MSARWIRFEAAGTIGFGTLDGERVQPHRGDMFGACEPSGDSLALADVTLLAPVQPGQIVGLWNNFMALAAKLDLPTPLEPLYFLKSAGAVLAPGGRIQPPRSGGKVVFEGELAVVIGTRCSGVSEADALAHVFGYTCANDVTVSDILNRDASFPQWSRAKSFDTFCPLGPVIVTGLNPSTLTLTTRLDGQVRQNYPLSDMRFSVARLVSAISHDMTLQPGDVILCGTSVGVGSMKPGSTVEVEIVGIGNLLNTFGAAS